ncbi:MAG: thioredoxin family protein [Myxococcales bacterium]|nr:thioredoxin family protein [Myxococcales bacterium]
MIARRWILLWVALAAACGDAEEAPAPSPPSGLEADPWTPMTEAALTARIEEARAEARASGRRVLLEFVATWCEDCREVVRLSHEDPARSTIEESYVVVYVEVGRFDRHRALIAEHHVDRIATLVVLDPETGRRVGRTTLEPITGGQRGLTSAALADWLRAPTPG